MRSGYSSPLAEPEPSFGRRFYNPGLSYSSPLAEPEPSSLRLPFLRNIPLPEPEPEPEPAPTLGRIFPVVNKSPAPLGPSFTTAAAAAVATPSVSSDPQPRANPLPISAPSPSPLPVPAVQDPPPQDFRSPELRSLPIFEDEIVFEAGYFCGNFSTLLSRIKSSFSRKFYPLLKDDFLDPLMLSAPIVPPAVPWNVDETLFEIVAAVPDHDAVRD